MLAKRKAKQSKKDSLSKLSNLLLNREDRLKENITKMSRYLSKADVFRAEKTVLGLVVALSFPQIPQYRVAKLIGISTNTIKNNLSNKKLKLGNIEKRLNLVIKELIW